VIDSRVIFPSGWFSISEFAGEGSKGIIDKLLFHIGFNIKVTNGVDGFSLFFGSSGLSPMLFYSGHMPLVDDGDYFFSGAVSVEGVEDIDIFLVHKNSFLVRCYLFKIFDKPVDSGLVKRFGKSLAAVCV
jgi:hypothetical protein